MLDDLSVSEYDADTANHRLLVSGSIDGWHFSAWVRKWPDGRLHVGRFEDTEQRRLLHGLSAHKPYGKQRASLAVKRRLAEILEDHLNGGNPVPKKRIETTVGPDAWW